MGVYTFVTHSSDVSVRAPVQGEVMVANYAGAWEPYPLDNPTAFPFLSMLAHDLVALKDQVAALQVLVADLTKPSPGKK